MIYPIVEFADDVVRYLDRVRYLMPVNVMRRWVPLVDPVEVKKLTLIQVVPEDLQQGEYINRSRGFEYEGRIGVFLAKVVDFQKLSEVDEVVRVYEEVLAALVRYAGDGDGYFVNVDVQPDPLVDHMRMADSRLYLGRITLTAKTFLQPQVEC